MIDAVASLIALLHEVFNSLFGYEAYVFEVALDYGLAIFCVFVFFAILLLPFYIVYRLVGWR